MAIAFHLSNKLLFSIGIFPFLSISLTTLYFSPNWPRKILNLKTQLGNQIKPKTDLNKKVVVSLLALYIGFQILFPLRHFLYPGKVAWTEEGHKFSWRMKLRDKHGTISYKITDPKTNKTWNLEPDFYLTKRQLRKLSTRPNLMLQFSHFMEDQFTKKGIKNVEVRTRARVSLNGREKQLIINPKADLAKQKESLLPAKWILPLNKQLKHK